MKRESAYDWLRVIATYAVIGLHVSWDYCNFEQVTAFLPKNFFVVGCFWNGVTRVAVPCFLLILGALLLSNDRNAEWENFYKKSFRKLGIPLLLISIVYVLYYYARNIWYLYSKTYEKISWTEPLLNWLKGIPGKHLWYMYMLIVLYLLVPWLIRMKKELSDKQWDKLGLLLILGGYIEFNQFLYR